MKPTYLVLLRHTADDLPLRLFDSHLDATVFAEAVGPWPSADIRKMFHVDCSTPCCVAVVTFNADGVPIDLRVVKEFD